MTVILLRAGECVLTQNILERHLAVDNKDFITGLAPWSSTHYAWESIPDMEYGQKLGINVIFQIFHNNKNGNNPNVYIKMNN